jgi:dihydroorotate dehydrogenase
MLDPLYASVIRPAFFAMDPEHAHEWTIQALAWTSKLPPALALTRSLMAYGDPRLEQTLWGRTFANPVGLAAGMDKEAVAIEAFAALGFSHVEVGTVTGQAQPGNPKPRLFRLKADEAVINRMGFNNTGCDAIAARLRRRYNPVGGARRPAAVLGINLGKSKVVPLEQAADDYEASVRALGNLADYVVVNVSSPNTPGLRDLQSEASLRPLLSRVRACLDRVAPGTPLLLKIAPDLADDGIDAAVDAARECRCDGLITTNTTIGRSGLRTSPARIAAIGAGGLSGSPVRQRSTAVLRRVAQRLRHGLPPGGSPLPVIGVGGIDSPEAAWEKIANGASLVQVYSALIYRGPGLVGAINRGLVAKLQACGLSSIADAVGRDL